MIGFRWNALNEADTHRANAMDKANKGRGGSSVTVYATTAAMFAARGGDTRTDGSKIADSVRDLWRAMKDDAVLTFRTAVETEQDDPADLFIPF